MRVLKIVAEGLTTSFRYPHFIQQVHPSYTMPPPATIYGHIASALGEWFDPQGVRFAYHFTFQKKQRDIEHTIMVKSATGKLKGTKIPKVLEGRVNPFYREILFHPRLTLYINQPEWEPDFRSPRYAVVLGRSQDLFTYTNIEIVMLEQAPSAYFEHTLLPYSTNRRTNRGFALSMPRFLDPYQRRYPNFSKYFVLDERISSNEFLWFDEKPDESYWIDPNTPQVNGEYLGLAFLSFTGDEDETVPLAR